MHISLFHYCTPLGGSLYIFPFMYMYILGSSPHMNTSVIHNNNEEKGIDHDV
jgi:hypothetical protein